MKAGIILLMILFSTGAFGGDIWDIDRDLTSVGKGLLKIRSDVPILLQDLTKVKRAIRDLDKKN